MTAWEMEAQRDREYFKRVLAQNGRRRCAQSHARIRRARITAAPVAGATRRPVSSDRARRPEHQAQFAFLQFPDSPVSRWRAGRRWPATKCAPPNRGQKAGQAHQVRGIGLAGDATKRPAVPGGLGALRRRTLSLPARGATARACCRIPPCDFPADGQPVNIQKMTGFVSQVEFADGKVWVPTRQNLENRAWPKCWRPRPKKQRPAVLYLRKGIDALIEELKKF